MAGKALPASKVDASPPSLGAESSYGPDDMTCAICLEQIQLENTAYVVGCEHAYCGELALLLIFLLQDSSVSSMHEQEGLHEPQDNAVLQVTSIPLLSFLLCVGLQPSKVTLN